MNPWMVTIGVTDGELPSREAILEEIRNVLGYERLEIQSVTGPESEEKGAHFFVTPTAQVWVTLLPAEASVPAQEDWIAACQRAWHWPAAGMEVVKMKRQIVVAVCPTVINHAVTLDALDAALLMNCVTVSVLKNTDAVAVYWHAAEKVLSPADFVEKSAGMNRKTLPVDLWVDFRMVPHAEDQTVSFGTFGLERFSLPEMEVSRTRRHPRWVMDWLFNLSHFVLENDVTLEDGQTFGRTKEEKFSVRREGAVVRLIFDE